MATTQLSGLVSGFDWKTFIDQTIQYSSTPITNMQTEQTTNLSQISALGSIKNSLTSLQSAVTDLQSADIFSGRTASASSSGSVLSATAATGAPLGSYTIAVTSLATASSLKGAVNIGAGLSTTSDVSGLTLATLPTAAAVSAGTFTINGQQVTIALSDSLQDVFDKISAVTTGHGDVTASYDPATDKISLSSGSGEIVLGASNDTSNFLSVARLSNSGSDTISSSSALGTLARTTPLSSAHLRTAVTTGSGSFSINGVSINYNTSSDSLNAIMARITASAAGVTASYDSNTDRVILTNKSTGDTGITASESSGDLLGALGLTTVAGSTLSHGLDAAITINGGDPITSKSNTLTPDLLGIDGLTVTATAKGTDTVNVSADTVGMQSKINTFISAYNAVQALITSQTQITSSNGKVTTSTLSGNHEVTGWAQTLRSDVFASISGLSGTVTRLESLGIDFNSGTSQLAIKDQTKLDAALNNNPDDVAAFFTQSTTGFGARLQSFINTVVGVNGLDGYISQETTTLTSRNSSLDDQIAAVQRQLDQQRAQLTASFVAMESAQQTQQSMQAQLTNAFSSISPSSSSKK